MYIYTKHIRILTMIDKVYCISLQFVCSIAAELLTLYTRFLKNV